MKFKKYTIFIILFFIPISGFAVTGSEYRALDVSSRSAWLIGAVDGLLTEELAQTDKQPQLAVCLAEYDWEQKRAIFEKFLENNPEIWNHPAAFSVRYKFRELCNLEVR